MDQVDAIDPVDSMDAVDLADALAMDLVYTVVLVNVVDLLDTVELDHLVDAVNFVDVVDLVITVDSDHLMDAVNLVDAEAVRETCLGASMQGGLHLALDSACKSLSGFVTGLMDFDFLSLAAAAAITQPETRTTKRNNGMLRSRANPRSPEGTYIHHCILVYLYRTFGNDSTFRWCFTQTHTGNLYYLHG